MFECTANTREEKRHGASNSGNKLKEIVWNTYTLNDVIKMLFNEMESRNEDAQDVYNEIPSFYCILRK
jgi:ribulose-5-phosphate 4-epimerase/fuculose-1-phosphate aldolase